MSAIAVCQRCGLPDSRKSVVFDAGVCSVCRSHEIKHSVIDWADRERRLMELADRARGTTPYDAIVPFGGGKDGAYTLYHMVRKLKLRCLAVTVDNRFLRQQAWHNSRQVIDALGVDQITFRPPMSIVQRLMRAGFSLAGTVCWHCNSSILAYPARMAVNLGVPLVVQAHSPAEYHSFPGRTYGDDPELDVPDEEYYTIASGIRFEELAAAVPDLPPASLHPFAFPTREELQSAGVKSIFLSNYIRWDEARQAEIIAAETGWRGAVQEGIPAGYEYEKFDCFLVGTHDYLRYIQEGYGRGGRLGAVEARLGRLSQQEALALAEESDGRRPSSLDRVLDMLSMDEEVFLDVATEHSRDTDFDLERVRRGKPLPDADEMPR